MAEDRHQENHPPASSLNERERREYIDGVNRRNKVMLERLSNIKPVLKKDKMLEDFKLHKKIGSQLRRQRFGVVEPKKHSPAKLATVNQSQTSSKAFDADSYITKFMSESSMHDNPITSISDFRKHVISTKRLQGSTSMQSMGGSNSSNINSQSINLDNNNNIASYGSTNSLAKSEGVKFELVHEPRQSYSSG